MANQLKEPHSELVRYAFGYSNKKPGLTYWGIIAGMVLFIAWKFWGFLP